MAIKALFTLSSTPELNLVVAPTYAYNTAVPFGYYQTRKEGDFYSVVNSNPNAIDVGQWRKGKSVGSISDFLLPNNYRIRLQYINSTYVRVGLADGNGNWVQGIYGDDDGISGGSVINHSCILAIFVDSTNKEATLQGFRDVRARGTASWSGNSGMINNGSIGIPTSTPFTNAQKKALYQAIQGVLPPEFLEDKSNTGGGSGDWYDDESDNIALPVLDNLNINGISNTKFFSCYKMSQDQLSALGNELWSSNMFTQLSNTVLKPTDFIVSLNLIPYDALGTTKLIKAGSILLNGVEGTLINSQFVRLDCGSVEVKEKWGGAIDYMTNIGLYLPFIGEVSLSPHEVMGATLGVSYTIDLLSGSCLASVKVTKGDLDSVLYQYNGNCASNFAITSGDYSQMWSAVFQGALTVASPKGSIMSAIADTNSNLLAGSGSPSSTRTGNLGSTVGFMSIKKPYLIITRPIQSLPDNYNKYCGFPSNVTLQLSECKGYTQISDIHLEGITATDAELKEIESLLKSGVIIA